MKIRNRIISMTGAKTAAMVCTTAAWMLAATAGLAQSTNDQRMGVSHPDAAPITLAPDTASTASSPASAPAKPSAAVPATDSSQIVYGPYVPYRAPGTAEPSAPAAGDPDANIVTEATAGQEQRRLLTAPTAKTDNDAGVVTYVPSRPGEVPEGALVKVRLREDLSTLTTKPGTKFSADVSEPVMRDGRVIVPVGSLLEGRVTWVRGGKRIDGAAAIHLEPMMIVLPDGMQYALRAQAIDTDRWETMKVDGEGTILRRDHSKKTAAAIGLSAGGGLAAGAMMGGVPGAVIGAGVGAGVGTVVWLKEDRQAELNKNLGVVFSLTEPMSVTPTSAVVMPLKIGTPGGE
ncbi:MAG: hypothetical protein ABSG84_04800 [Acidobacteriaceae bacterium]|jgi:hypothetical protein